LNHVSKNERWLACPAPNPKAALRLFCFPYSGAGASIFYPWVASFPPTVEVCPVELPGRGKRIAESPFSRMPPLVEAAGQGLLSYLDKPFAFFGHSLGAVVGFELARLLQRRHDLSPVRLFVSGHRAPQIVSDCPPVHDLPDSEFAEEVRRLHGTPDEVLDHAELRELLLPILRADFAASETYAFEAGKPLTCPVTAFGGLQDEHVTREHLEAWRGHTTALFGLRMLPGDHFFLNTSRSMLIAAIARELNRATMPA
jgi:medium-chain acyl-[acyl-carrier-protein] hydrolase